MNTELEEKIASLVASLMTDGFNRSMGALRKAGAVNTKKMDREYCGVGSRYYDLVTEQMELTVKYARPVIQEMVEDYEKGRNDAQN